MIYRIYGTSEYGTEEIDEFDTRKEAQDMVSEYRMAYGAGWSFRIKREKA